MINGNVSKFAVNWDITEIVGTWVFGHFYLLINGLTVGNPEDSSVDLKGCLGWVKDFLIEPQNRYEPGLYEMDKNQIYLRLASSVLVNDDDYGLMSETYENTYARFHISHIGMSSFDSVTLLLIKNEEGKERCIWKTSDGEIMDTLLEAGEIESVFSEFAVSLQSAISNVVSCKP